MNNKEVIIPLSSQNKLIGVQRNHSVEYVGGPAAPT